MYALTFRARLKYIEDTLEEIWDKHDDFALDTMDCYMSLTICPYHKEGADLEEAKRIKEEQKKCSKYPKANFFLDGCCEHYRAVTGGHCDYDIVRFKKAKAEINNKGKTPEKKEEKEKPASAMGFMGGA